MLKLQERSKPSTGIWLVKPNTTVGSDKACDFIPSSKKVARVHIELLSNHDQITLNDRSNGKSIFVNDIPLGHYGPLKHGDIIRLADAELEIIDPKEELAADDSSSPVTTVAPSLKSWRLVAVGDWLSGQSFEIHKKATLGRDTDCDITIPGTHLSRRHAGSHRGKHTWLVCGPLRWISAGGLRRPKRWEQQEASLAQSRNDTHKSAHERYAPRCLSRCSSRRPSVG